MGDWFIVQVVSFSSSGGRGRDTDRIMIGKIEGKLIHTDGG